MGRNHVGHASPLRARGFHAGADPRPTRRQFHDRHTGDAWDLLAEMQHYRLPTRLLDWSLSLTTAAFFAVYYARQKGKAAADNLPANRTKLPDDSASNFLPTVWILNP